MANNHHGGRPKPARRATSYATSYLLIGALLGSLCAVSTSVAQETHGTRNTHDTQVAARASTGVLVSVHVHQAFVRDVLEDVARQAGLTLSYRGQPIDVAARVSLALDSVPVTAAFAAVLRGTGVTAVISPGGHAIITRIEMGDGNALSVAPSIVGRVTDSATRVPIGGVTIAIAKTKWSTVTRKDGTYALSGVSTGTWTLTARLLGYAPVSQSVVIRDTGTVVANFSLVARAATLDQVVTTATGDRRRVEVGSQITTLDVPSIMKTAPITTVTDLLVGRVPGLTAIKSTGAPGDPTRLRLRGTSSLTRNNDPIVIVDGVRIYAEQSGARGANLAASAPSYNGTNNNTIGGSGSPLVMGVSQAAVPATSPLDEIDPNSIAKIEVLNGPSASAIYGSDAANGVIIITTKHGRPGTTRWTVNADRGTSSLPDDYAPMQVRWGHTLTDSRILPCAITDFTCAGDSVVTYNNMADARLTPLGTGTSTSLSMDVSGGTDALTYRLGGSYQDELGYLKLPDEVAEQYQTAQGVAPPSWMQRPSGFTRSNGTVTLAVTPMRSVTLTYSGALTQSSQRRTNLESDLLQIQRTFADLTHGVFYTFLAGTGNLYQGNAFATANQYLADAYRHMTDDVMQITHAVNGTWQPSGWATASADAGYNTLAKDDKGILARGLVLTADSVGQYDAGRGTTGMSTLNGRVTLRSPSLSGISVSPTVGINYVRTTENDTYLSGYDLVAGTTSITGAQTISATSSQTSTATYGVYFEPAFNLWDRLYVSPAIRFDGGTSFGANARTFALPKVSLSWLASNEQFFPLKQYVDALRFRLAYGQSGVQPGPVDRERLYTMTSVWLDGSTGNGLSIASFGNTQLRPERSVETEGGFDLDLLDSRISLGLTWYGKMTRDALINVPVAPSVLGGVAAYQSNLVMNLGRVRNRGVELSAAITPVRSTMATWTANLTYSSTRNTLLRIADGVAPYLNRTGSGARYVVGYPLAGLWAKPLVSYADVDGNGVIDATEIAVGDSLAYLGPPYPKYTAGIFNTVTLLNGRLSVSAGLQFTDGAAQVNQSYLVNRWLSPVLTESSTPLAQQAAAIAMSQTVYPLAQIVSTLRFDSFSLSYLLPPAFASRIRAQSVTLSLQGSNLGTHSNYSGIDPNVNVFSANEQAGVADAGVLPSPRTWRGGATVTF